MQCFEDCYEKVSWVGLVEGYVEGACGEYKETVVVLVSGLIRESLDWDLEHFLSKWGLIARSSRLLHFQRSQLILEASFVRALGCSFH